MYMYCRYERLDPLILIVSTQASKMCDKYNRTKGAGTIAHPERHPFFQKLAPMVKLHLDKSERENGFMWVTDTNTRNNIS